MMHLYYHGGSANHGCEAIVRSTEKIVNQKMKLWTFSPNEDIFYGLDDIVEIKDDSPISIDKSTIKYFHSAVSHKLTGTDYTFTKYAHDHFFKAITEKDVCMSIGGDNYCYAGVEKLQYYNRALKKRGAKTVLWGCSVDPKVLTSEVIKDLKSYDLITVRETLSYEGLLNAGIKDNLNLCADPAFHLDIVQTELPKGYKKENTVGINFSPLVVNAGNMVYENYYELVKYIIRTTSDNVLLIPHVVKAESDDRKVLKQLFTDFKDSGRIFMLEDCNCMELKGYIAQCKYFVGARTHATIAAYSTYVPTLVVGYSIKARGIAKDIFGIDENYVIPVQNFKTNTDLLNSYLWLENHAVEIEKHLRETIPVYKQNSLQAVDALKEIW